MGTRYQQLTREERWELARLQAAGCSYRQIAAALIARQQPLLGR